MAEPTTDNAQERDPDPQTDKENRPNPLEQIQPKPASKAKRGPLQESQSRNLPEPIKKNTLRGTKRNNQRLTNEKNRKECQRKLQDRRSLITESSPLGDKRRSGSKILIDWLKKNESVQKRSEAPGSAPVGSEDGNQSEQVQAATEDPPSSPQEPGSAPIRTENGDRSEQEREDTEEPSTSPQAPRSSAVRTEDGSDSEQERQDTEEPSTSTQDSQSTTTNTKDGNRSEPVRADTKVPPSSPQKPKSEGRAPSSQNVSLSFKWIGGKAKRPVKFNVDPHEMIIDGLKRSKFFMKKYKPSQYLSIYARHLNAMINPSAPCGGLKDKEELEVRQSNVNVPETPPYKTGAGGRFIKVHKKGSTEGGAVRVILHHNENNADDIPMAVFGYEGETFEEALRNDKRFKDNNVLSLIGTRESKYESTVTLALLPNDTYTIIVSSVSKQPPEASSVTTTKPSCDPNAEFKFPPIESDAYKKMAKNFTDQFNEYVSTHKKRRKAWRIIKKDFSYNIYQKRPMTAQITQILGEHSRNVAWILVKDNGRVVSMGTFFLLTQSLGLTCYHVVKDVLECPCYSIEITFDYTHMDAEKHYFGVQVEAYSEEYDYAFLRLETSPFLGQPGGLLGHLALPPQHGAVAIIGHPGGQCKHTDLCSVINFSDRKDSILKTAYSHPSYVHVLTKYHFLEMLDTKLLTYKTCLYEGASGAPVFNDGGKLVAMHSGGYNVDASPPATESVIEYGRSMVEIIMMGAVEIEDLGYEFSELVKRNEDLQSYMFSGSHSPYMRNVIASLKM